ncbi:helix-turn-helix domain-containing protein [Saccharopolyspora pogona]|uniref:helix-turn-helix domain-containing protein n=1 Tax=Saccharopolyspora pogona TaxID=333966 RepID=UPI001CC23049|nr:helix-turn-helix transcriptional regulator [Saccharopolyspora pogona]
MEERISPTVRLRRLTRGIRRWRAEAGLRQEDVAAALDWSKPKLSRFENAEKSAGPAEVLALAAVYGVPDAERDQYVALALQARQKGWWQRYGQDTLASNFEEYVGLESEAAEVREFAAELIPGLLQTERYATELIQAWIPQADEVVMKERADLRAQRQARLHETNPLTVGTVIHESALRQLVGGPEVMREQLKHLVASAKLPNVPLQVLPFSTGAIPALGAPFILLSFPDQEDPDVAFAEHLTSSVYMEDPAEVEMYTLNYSALRSKALSQKESITFLNRLAREL